MDERDVRKFGLHGEPLGEAAKEMDAERWRIGPAARQGDVLAEVLVKAIAPGGSILCVRREKGRGGVGDISAIVNTSDTGVWKNRRERTCKVLENLFEETFVVAT